jgi:predicted O-methyltransferase YrrM
MKSNAPVLYPNDAVAERVTEYSQQHSLVLPAHIPAYHAHIVQNHPHSEYMISNFQAQANVFLARAIGAKRILEIGVYVGYSSMVWSHAVGPQGSVVGLEFSSEYASDARVALEKNGVGNVEIVEGDALQTISTLNPEEPFDLIFIDAQKSGYPAYLDSILAQSQPGSSRRLLRPGGLIIADNVLRRAIVADESDDNPYAVKARAGLAERSEYQKDRDVESLRKYNDEVAKSDRLESWLVPLYDGVSLARLLD